MTRIGILFLPGMEELDALGPWEVFGMAQKAGADFELVSIAERKGPLTCALGLRLDPDFSIDDAPPIDVLLVPGGLATRQELGNKRLLDWIARVSEDCTWVTSVCTGAMILIAAGPARGKRVTTHWAATEMLAEAGPATFVDGVRFVRDGKVVTSAGVSAGIDMSLWIVGQLKDPAFARQVQRYMQYDPAPPYTAEAS
jgi:transcriptional regulator GlxA family with amidase domain